MRLLASFEQERQAFSLYSYLKQREIKTLFEAVKNPAGIITSWDVWVLEEDDFDKACELTEAFYKDPAQNSVEKIQADSPSLGPKQDPDALLGVKLKPLQHPLVRIRLNVPLTRLLIAICVIVFLWTNIERLQLVKKYPSLGEYALFTQTTQNALYDFPTPYEKLIQFFEKRPQLDVKNKSTWSIRDRSIYLEIEKMPLWKGYYDNFLEKRDNKKPTQAPMFTKIQEGDIWRLWTPIFLHGNFLHILFNMLWLFLLGRELEIKIGKLRLIGLCVVIGLITNTCQYLMSGPLFLGFSGVICGFAGFIWTREKIAPWEGYTVPKGTLGFLFLFVLGMMALQVIAFFASILHIGKFSVSGLGNTGHVVGLMIGSLVARIPLFYRLRG